jgi:uncharacterized protein YhaN
MRIESIDIHGFGCLVNRRYEFPADRAVLVIADNETGKSTLAAAILAALCGFPKRRQPGETVKLSEVYKPWNSETYAVEMDISVDGRSLRIERDFGKDTFVVRDRETGKDISAAYDKDLTAHILRLPREDFQRIAFISGKDVPSFGPAPGIQARLSALVEGSTEDTGAETAIAALDGSRYTLDSGGPLKTETATKRLSEGIAQKRQSMNALDVAMDAAAEDAGRLEQSKKLHAELSAELSALDSEVCVARSAEAQTNERRVAELQAKLLIEQTEARLGAIKQERLAGKQLGVTIAIGGIGLAVISFCAWLIGLINAGPSVGGALVGIAVAAYGAVRASKAELLHSEEKYGLERQIQDAQAQESDASAHAGRSSVEIEAEQRALRQELDNISATIIDLEKRVGATVDAYHRDYGSLHDDLQRLERELARAERFGKAIEVAKQVLRQVAEDSRRRWAAALNRSASSILPHLNPDYDDLRFDDSLGFTVRHVPDGRTLEQADIDARLSTGAKDQVYLAVRLACCEELSRGSESIPALLDDPLMAADDSRFASGLRYIVEEFAENNQVIVLSCSKRRHEALAGEEWFAERMQRVDLGTQE